MQKVVDWNEIDYCTILSVESRTIQIWRTLDSKFIGSVTLDKNLESWTPFFTKGEKYLPINWAVEKLKKGMKIK